MLTKHERRILGDIERDTRLSDPEFVARLDGLPARRHRRHVVLLIAAIAASVTLLALGVVALLLGVAAAAITSAAAMAVVWMLSAWYWRRC